MFKLEKPKRIKLVFTNDPYTSLKSGDLGYELGTNSDDRLMCHWDNGSTLGLIPGVDQWEYVETDEREAIAELIDAITLIENVWESGDLAWAVRKAIEKADFWQKELDITIEPKLP